MNDKLDPKREARRRSFQGLSRISFSGTLDSEFIEDLVAAAPEVQILNVDILDNKSLELSHFKELDALITLRLMEGESLEYIDLDGVQELSELVGIEISVNPETSIDEIDLSPLANHPELRVFTLACPVKNLKNLQALTSIPNLESIGLYSLDVEELDLSALSSCEKLSSLYIGDLGTESPSQPYTLSIPRYVPLKVLEITDCYSKDLELHVDFSFIQDIRSMDSLKLRNCNLSSFDFSKLASLQRIGSLDLSENRFAHLDITPILEMPTFTERALGDPPFVIDSEVTIQISKDRESDVSSILDKEDIVIEDHEGHYAIEYEFGHQWLKVLIDTHPVEWI